MWVVWLELGLLELEVSEKPNSNMDIKNKRWPDAAPDIHPNTKMNQSIKYTNIMS